MTLEHGARVIPVEASNFHWRGLRIKRSWKRVLRTEEESYALAWAASVLCTDPSARTGMTAATMSKKIRAAFIIDSSKPSEACTTRDKGTLDCRRWDGRSYVACGKQWEVPRGKCNKYKGCVDRIEKMNLTGNPTKEDLYRCASLLYSDGSQSISHVYDCVRNPSYHILQPFKFHNMYEFLCTQTTLLNATGLDPHNSQKQERPIGNKATKKLKEENVKKAKATAEDNNPLTASIKRIEDVLATNGAKRNELTQQKLSFQREKMEWEMVKTLFGPGSDACPEDRNAIGSLLRKHLMNSLSQNIGHTPVKKVCVSQMQNETNGLSTSLKMSSVSALGAEKVESTDSIKASTHKQ